MGHPFNHVIALREIGHFSDRCLLGCCPGMQMVTYVFLVVWARGGQIKSRLLLTDLGSNGLMHVMGHTPHMHQSIGP